MSAPPYWHCGRTVFKRSIDQLIALLPAAAMAVVHWGLPALRVMCLAMAVCVAVEAICCWAMDRKSTIDDFTAVVAGLLYAFMLPAGAPWWIVVVGAVSAMLFGKMLFGGHGNNPLCTPLIGWAVAVVGGLARAVIVLMGFYLAWQAYQGKPMRAPYIGEFDLIR